MTNCLGAEPGSQIEGDTGLCEPGLAAGSSLEYGRMRHAPSEDEPTEPEGAMRSRRRPRPPSVAISPGNQGAVFRRFASIRSTGRGKSSGASCHHCFFMRWRGNGRLQTPTRLGISSGSRT